MADTSGDPLDGAELQAILDHVRESQTAELEALEGLLLDRLDDANGDLAEVERTLEKAIENHERAREELEAMRRAVDEQG